MRNAGRGARILLYHRVAVNIHINISVKSSKTQAGTYSSKRRARQSAKADIMLIKINGQAYINTSPVRQSVHGSVRR